jgi:lysophospholipase L1-like esterase
MWLLVVPVVSLVGLTGCIPPKSYVSLGDSFTAGPLIPVQRDDPLGCLRSTNNYPSLVAPSLVIDEHRDPSCSGAQTDDMTAPQGVEFGPNPPQFDSLDAHTSVVTLGIGGNDIGFLDIAITCGNAFLTSGDPLGTPCKEHYTNADGSNQVSQTIAATAPKVAAVLDGIQARSPNAKIFVVGYLAIIPETITLPSWFACVGTLPIAMGDFQWLRDDVHKALNAMIEAEAEAAGAVFVDTYTPSIGHDACQPPVVRWVEPVPPGHIAAPVHPNLGGMQAVAQVVLASMQANGVPTQ